MSNLTTADLHQFTQQHAIALLYFKGKHCSVCAALEPKLKALAEEMKVALLHIDMPTNLHLAATEMVLAVPVVKLYIQGRVVWKEGAYLQIPELRHQIAQWQLVLSASTTMDTLR